MLQDGPHTHLLGGEQDLFPALLSVADEAPRPPTAADTLTTSEVRQLLRRMGLPAQGKREQLVKALKSTGAAR